MSESNEIDWRKILVAYIKHVGLQEGTDFLPWEISGLTEEEMAALMQASEEAGE